jgi:undecaprenyl-diphosphatase
MGSLRAAYLLAVCVFILLAVVAHGLRADPIDLAVTRAVQRLTGLDGVLRAVSWIWYVPQTLVLHGAMLVAVFGLGYRLEAAILLLASLGSSGLNALVKQLVARPRPSAPLVHVLIPTGGYSFPSGHVMGFTSFFGVLAVLAWLRLPPGPPRTLLIVLCAVLIGLVGPSRIYLGVHWFTDVAGGYLLGTLWLLAVLQIYAAVRR